MVAVAVASVLVAGTVLAPIQSFARSGNFADTPSLKHSILDGVSVNLKHRDQHMNQENLCYRDNTCRDANAGHNTLGNDNSVTGFADQSHNIQQSAAANKTTPTTTTPANQTTGNSTITPSLISTLGTLMVTKEVICPTGVNCPQPSAFTIHVTGNNPSLSSFPGSSSPTTVRLGPGIYNVTEDIPPTPSNLALTQHFNGDCNTTINAGETKNCNIVNEYTLNLNPNGDDDGDGIPNGWEQHGVDEDHDGTVDYILPGANPLHKDLYIEVDFMQFHRPIDAGITDVINSFANAPLTNPDGHTGINLHVTSRRRNPPSEYYRSHNTCYYKGH